MNLLHQLIVFAIGIELQVNALPIVAKRQLVTKVHTIDTTRTVTDTYTTTTETIIAPTVAYIVFGGVTYTTTLSTTDVSQTLDHVSTVYTVSSSPSLNVVDIINSSVVSKNTANYASSLVTKSVLKASVSPANNSINDSTDNSIKIRGADNVDSTNTSSESIAYVVSEKTGNSDISTKTASKITSSLSNAKTTDVLIKTSSSIISVRSNTLSTSSKEPGVVLTSLKSTTNYSKKSTTSILNPYTVSTSTTTSTSSSSGNSKGTSYMLSQSSASISTSTITKNVASLTTSSSFFTKEIDSTSTIRNTSYTKNTLSVSSPTKQSVIPTSSSTVKSTSSSIPSKTSTSAKISTSTSTPTSTIISNDSATSSSSTSATGIGYLTARPSALVYSPYNADSTCKSADKIYEDLALIKSKGVYSIRVYGTDCNSVSTVEPAALTLGITINQGLWISANGVDSIDDGVANIIDWGTSNGWDIFEFITIGNEAIIAGYCTVPELIAKISSVKAQLKEAGYMGMVTTAEPPVSFEQHPELCTTSEIDFVGINPHAYFDTYASANSAGTFVKGQVALIQGVCGTSNVKVIETGYPSAGLQNGGNVPSPENQLIAVQAILNEMQNDVTILTTFNDLWKAPGPYGIEQSFGIIQLLEGI